MKFSKKAASILLIAVLLLSLSTGCSTTADSTGSISSASADTTSLILNSEVNPEDLSFSSKDLDGSWDDSTAVHVTLADGNITADGSGATADRSVLTITKAGTYVLTGTLSDGQIVVNASKDDKVQIVLNDVEITCSDNAAVYVKQADKVFLTAADSTVNTLTCGDTISDEAATDEVTGAVFSHDDLTVNGTGSLTVNGNYKHGIVSKDDLVLAGVTLTLNSVSDGLRGKDCVKIASGTYTITAGTDGIQSNNDSDATLGFVYIAGGTFTITAGNDGIQAETLLCATDGDFNITTGGGSANASTKTDGGPSGGGPGGGRDGHMGSSLNPSQSSGTPETTDQTAASAAIAQTIPVADSSSNAAADTSDTTSDSAKALKSGAALVLAGGNYTIDSKDDSVHSNGDVSVRQGCTLSASSGDDGIHADSTLSVSGGTITISKSYEGLEGETIDVSGGTIHITASDDGLNAAGGSDSSTQGFSIAAGTSADGETPQLTISGGTLYVNASGDGLDSNGDLTVTGGEIYVDGPTNGGNGALDYGEGCTAAITGGTVVAAGASGMAVGFGDSSTQCSMLVIFDSTIAGGTELTVTDSSGKVVLAYTPSKDYQTAVISSSALTKGSVYTVAAGDISAQITLSGVSSTSGTQSNGMGGPQSGNSQNSGTVFDRDSGSSASGDTKSGPPDGGGPQGGPSGGPKERGSSNSAGGQTSDSGTT